MATKAQPKTSNAQRKEDNKMTTVVGTKESKHLETGKKYEVTKKVADRLIKNGQAAAKILIGLVMLLSFSLASTVSAQSSAFTMTGNGDTIVDAGTKTNTLKLTQKYVTTSIQVVITKISGTVAGTITLQGSNDGTNWVTHDTTYLSLGVATATATNTTGSKSYPFLINGDPYLWYRITYTGTGTMSAKMSSYLVGRQ